jgi:hypothetical protein
MSAQLAVRDTRVTSMLLQSDRIGRHADRGLMKLAKHAPVVCDNRVIAHEHENARDCMRQVIRRASVSLIHNCSPMHAA